MEAKKMIFCYMCYSRISTTDGLLQFRENSTALDTCKFTRITVAHDCSFHTGLEKEGSPEICCSARFTLILILANKNLVYDGNLKTQLFYIFRSIQTFKTKLFTEPTSSFLI
jgi:hypothetical protein